MLDGPHAPTVLANGNILAFDNGRERGYSRVLEIDPRTRKIVWEYSGYDHFLPFSLSGSSAQRLANGNTLIVTRAAGIIIEVSPDKRVVWGYRYKLGNLYRAVKYRKNGIGWLIGSNQTTTKTSQ